MFGSQLAQPTYGCSSAHADRCRYQPGNLDGNDSGTEIANITLAHTSACPSGADRAQCTRAGSARQEAVGAGCAVYVAAMQSRRGCAQSAMTAMKRDAPNVCFAVPMQEGEPEGL